MDASFVFLLCFFIFADAADAFNLLFELWRGEPVYCSAPAHQVLYDDAHSTVASLAAPKGVARAVI